MSYCFNVSFISLPMNFCILLSPKSIKVLNLNMEVAATSYQKIYNVAQNYDVILLAPQVSYVKLQVEKVFKNKLCKNGPAGT